MAMRGPGGVWKAAACLAAGLGLRGAPACAQPWIPAAGAGNVETTIRLYDSNRAFSPTSFGSATYPSSSTDQVRQLRASLVYGLGGGWAFNFDLRGDAYLKTKHGTTLTTTGLQNQYIGLSHGLRQGATFADALSLYVITPSITRPQGRNPAIGVDPVAIEGLYSVGVRGWLGSHRVSATLQTGPWIYPGNGVVQIRTTLIVGIRLLPRWRLSGSLYFPRTVLGTRPLLSSDPANAELYDLLRGGVRAEYQLTPRVRLIAGFERRLAGEHLSAGDRFSLGTSLDF